MFSDKNPMMSPVPALAGKARAERRLPERDNPWSQLQEQISAMTTAWLETWGQIRDDAQEALFHAVYGSAVLQGWLGVSRSGRPRPKPETSPEHTAALNARIQELRTSMDQGGPLEAVVRALVYIALGQGCVDARSFEILRRILKAHPDITLDRYKAIVREQWARLTIDPQAALKALPRLLPSGAEARRALLEEIRAIRTAAGELDGEGRRRLEEIEALFDGKAAPARVRRNVEART
jgi:hypothetical protein